MRARMALAISGQACELREVELGNRPDELRAVSEKATVPVLVLAEGRVLDESLEVMLWALGQHDPEGWLLEDSTGRAASEALIARCDVEFKPHLDRYKYSNRYEDVGSEDHRELASQFLRDLDEQLLQSEFLFGSKRSLADIAIGPFVRQFAFADREWFDEQSWACLRAWLNSFVASPLFAQVMIKRRPWRPDSEALVVAWDEQADS